MPSLPARIDGWLASYGAFVNNLGVTSLVLLAMVTGSAGMKFFMNLKMPSMENNGGFILAVTTVYLLGIALFIVRYRRNELPNQPPMQYPPSQISNILIFLKSGISVSSLAFFTAVDDPLKSINSLYVPAICLCSYFHILVILVVLRRSEDYGISDGCLAASYGLLFSMSESILEKILLIIPTIALSGLRNLQFYYTLQSHLQLPLIQAPKSKQQKKEERREMKAKKIYQPQASKLDHRRGSSL